MTDILEPIDIPREFGRYRIVRALGRGGMGSVYLARDTQLDRLVALKLPHFDPQADAEMSERFDREARTAANLAHPNTCQVLDVGSIDGRRYLTMEFIDGQPLSRLVGSKKLSDKRAILLVCKIAGALDEAHRLDIIHRDLKPANIMLTAAGEPKVTDFGLARRGTMGEQRLTRTGMVIGTPAYMPAEQLHGDLDAIGPHSDVYSLGVILYELLTGQLPFDIPPNAPVVALFARILTASPDPPTRHRPDLDPRLEAIVLKAIAKEYADRYDSMSALGTALNQFLKGQKLAQESGELRPAPRRSGESGRSQKLTKSLAAIPSDLIPTPPRWWTFSGQVVRSGSLFLLLLTFVFSVTSQWPALLILFSGLIAMLHAAVGGLAIVRVGYRSSRQLRDPQSIWFVRAAAAAAAVGVIWGVVLAFSRNPAAGTSTHNALVFGLGFMISQTVFFCGVLCWGCAGVVGLQAHNPRIAASRRVGWESRWRLLRMGWWSLSLAMAWYLSAFAAPHVTNLMYGNSRTGSIPVTPRGGGGFGGGGGGGFGGS